MHSLFTSTPRRYSSVSGDNADNLDAVQFLGVLLLRIAVADLRAVHALAEHSQIYLDDVNNKLLPHRSIPGHFYL